MLIPCIYSYQLKCEMNTFFNSFWVKIIYFKMGGVSTSNDVFIKDSLGGLFNCTSVMAKIQISKISFLIKYLVS